jgi:hypothetical protein
MVDSLLLVSALNGILKSIKEHTEVFFHIHLFEHVARLAFPIFE